MRADWMTVAGYFEKTTGPALGSPKAEILGQEIAQAVVQATVDYFQSQVRGLNVVVSQNRGSSQGGGEWRDTIFTINGEKVPADIKKGFLDEMKVQEDGDQLIRNAKRALEVASDEVKKVSDEIERNRRNREVVRQIQFVL